MAQSAAPRTTRTAPRVRCRTSGCSTRSGSRRGPGGARGGEGFEGSL